jgi:hypothetical protein
MKKVKTTILVVILMVLSTYVIGVAAESVLIKNQVEKTNENINDNPFFFTEITFTIVINDGCGCNPIEGVTISAYGGAGFDENVTNIDGMCILVLEIDSVYTVTITSEDYIPIIFEFVVIGEQYFVFQMSLKDESVSSIMPAFHQIMNLLNR